VEDLGPARVFRGRKRRLGASTTVAAVALVGLLAAGLGVLGGRPEALPGTGPNGSGVGLATASTPPRSSALPASTPKVTPAAPCGPEPERAPQVYLEVNGASTLGADIDGSSTQVLLIPSDATTQIRIAGDACAIAWHIRLADPTGNLVPLEIQPNPGMDAGFANQNRFQIAFDRVRDKVDEQEVEAGLDFAVQAGLDFAGGIGVIATWRVRFPIPAQRPQ